MMQLMLMLFPLFSACYTSQTEDAEVQATTNVNPDKVLIVYLSRTNNTKAIAEMIQKQVGGTLAALELENPYPKDYKQIVEQVANENETGFLPPLKTKINNIQNYEVVFIGFPTRAGTMACLSWHGQEVPGGGKPPRRRCNPGAFARNRN